MKNKRTFTFMVFDIHSKESLLPHSYHLQVERIVNYISVTNLPRSLIIHLKMVEYNLFR